MADSDGDYASDGKLPAQESSSDAERRTRRKTRSYSVQKAQRSAKKKKRRSHTATVPTDLATCTQQLSNIKKRLKGVGIDGDMSLRVMAHALKLQIAYLEEKARRSVKDPHKMRPPRVRDRVCEAFSTSSATYSQIIGLYNTQNCSYETVRLGNPTAKVAHIPQTSALLVKVRDFVRSRRLKKQRTTARQVLDMLVEEKRLVVLKDGNKYQQKALRTAMRTVQRWLVDFAGYKRGKRTGNIVPSAKNIAKKHKYLRLFFANRALPPAFCKREVYTDKSYIHEHYNKYDDSIWDPNNE